MLRYTAPPGVVQPPEQRENIFIPFATANEQTRRKDGIGLGESEMIIGIYDDCAVSLAFRPSTTWILNASTKGYVTVADEQCRGSYQVVARDKFGRIVSKQMVTMPQSRLDVEVGNSLEITAGSLN